MRKSVLRRATALVISCLSLLGRASHGVEPKDPATPGNLALGKTPLSRQADGPPERVVDGLLLAEGTSPDSTNTLVLKGTAGAFIVNLGATVPVRGLVLQADTDELVLIEGSLDAQRWARLVVIKPGLPGVGLRTRHAELPEPSAVRFLAVHAEGGDGLFHVSEFQAFAQLPSPWPPVLEPLEPAAAAGSWWTRLDDDTLILVRALLALIGAAAVFLASRPSEGFRARVAGFILTAVTALAALSFWNFGRFHGAGPFAGFLHVWDTFHYHIGAKYFPELGYTRLYDAVVLAQEESALGNAGVLKVRNLTTNRLEPTDQALARSFEVRARFSPERWSLFQRDIAWFRERASPQGRLGMLQDNGFNGTPAWLVLGRLLTGQAPISTDRVFVLSLLDPILLLGMWGLVFWAFGARVAAVAILLWATNYPARFYWNGGAFLRMDWLFFLVAGISCLKKNRPGLGGFALGLATLLRIFPGAVLLAVLLHGVLRGWRSRWEGSTVLPRFVAGAALAAILVLPASLFVSSPDPAGERNVWIRFAQNSRKHMETPFTNAMGLRPLLAYEGDTTAAKLVDAVAMDPFDAWKAARRRATAATRPAFFLLAAALTALALRASQREEPWVAAVLGVALVPVCFELACYYACVLLALAFLSLRRPVFGVVLVSLSALSGLAASLFSWDDQRFLVINLLILGMVCAFLFTLAFPPKDGDRMRGRARDSQKVGKVQSRSHLMKQPAPVEPRGSRLTPLVLALLTSAAVFMGTAQAADAKGGKDAKDPKESKDTKESKGTKDTKDTKDPFSGLEFRGIGPALTSGRVSDLAVHPAKNGTYYVAVASGGVFKTINSGTTFTPIFDSQASYSIGCVTIDPRNPLTIWVGSGENNSQRSVAYGDGVYKSVDGGKSWENVGLKASEHIGKILVDPRASDTVYVAAQGPLWAPGGDRGLYKTTDGGKSWKPILTISENTGVSDLWMDPRSPDVLYATSYQRRRHVFTLINGGPESAIYKSTDAGTTWKKLANGLPKADLGRIGLAVSPPNPDVVYAIVEASAAKDRGFYRSTDAGGNWERMSGYLSTGPQYYQELVPDPKKVDRVYSMDTWMMVTEDGGKTFHKVGERTKHVDNHALYIDPENTNYLLAGCDGGIYESWDRGATWHFKSNLPIVQLYRVALDNASPIYNVYGGTQDNNSLGGPSRTTTAHGIANSDWFITLGGDGFQPRVDPTDPNIAYTQSQHGNLARFSRRTGENVEIQPQAAKGDPPLRYNWDSPFIISPHSHKRLYFAAQRLFRSDDRGDSWRAISPDLTQQIDRNKLKVMGRVWGVDAVAKNASTSFFGNLVSLTESPKLEGLLYVGADDGLIQVTEDGGANWRKVERVAGVPAGTYVSALLASRHDAGVVYGAFDNHKNGDFKPYLCRSPDRGRTWTSITGDLPQRGTVYAIAEDPAMPELLFAGTEFGVFVTRDGGKKWWPLKGGLPTIQVRDLAIQERENDLVLATFGRGFYILDDYTPLRLATPETLEREATLFPVKKAQTFIPSEPLGLKGKANMGDSYFSAPNPPFGAVFTYHLKEEIKGRKGRRQDAEKKLVEKGGEVTYPTWAELRAEAQEEDPAIVLTVTDEDGEVVRRLTGPVKAGFHRVAWDLRYPPTRPTDLTPSEDYDPYNEPPPGPLAMPGAYKVTMAKRVDGLTTTLGEPQTVVAEPLSALQLPEKDRAEHMAFQRKTARLSRAVLGAREAAKETDKRLKHLKKALDDTSGGRVDPAKAADPALRTDLVKIEEGLREVELALNGDTAIRRINEPTPPSIVERVQGIISAHWQSTSAPTATQRQEYAIAAEAFSETLKKLQRLLETDLKSLEDRAEAAFAPWTPGRVPRWSPE